MKKPAIEIPPPDPARLARASEVAEGAPMPAQSRQVRLGTAGWTDPTLTTPGLFYPKGKQSSESRLKFYAEHFSVVEVDASYYTLLSPDVAERWLTWTPQSFHFDIKAFPILTRHPIDVARLPVDLRDACRALGHERRVYPDKLPDELGAEIRARFLEFVRPLVEAKRLGSILIQFPPWFTATRSNSKWIEQLRSAMPELPFAVEFRHASWFESSRLSRVLDLLRGLRMSYVCIDEPLIRSELFAVTNPELAVVRFHGRNTSGFQKRGASVHERFDYLYDPDELRGAVGPVRQLESQANSVHAIFNNCVRNYAVLNAKDLAVLLEGETQDGGDDSTPGSSA